MDEWEKFNETSSLQKEELSSNLNMEDIKDADYSIQKEFEIKKIGKHHDLHLKSDHYFWLMLSKTLEKCV